jgi:glycosyltransferase involved in cell wall biosynthesis
MTRTPLVSVAIATYNYARYLPAAIESVLGQTVADLELIVTDDGSTDQTPEVIRPYLADPRFSYHQIEHIGVTPAKNHAIRRGRGEYIALLDSDDQWQPDKLERQLDLFRSNPRLGIAFARRGFFDPDGRDMGVDHRELYRGRVVEQLLLDNFICYSSAMVPRAVLDRVGLMDETLVHPSDYDLWLRIAMDHPVDFVDEPMVRYRQHPGISRRSTALERRAEVDRVTSRFLDDYGGRRVIRPEVLRLAELQSCCNIAWEYREISPLGAATWYLRAILRAPGYWPAWRGLAATLVLVPCRRRHTTPSREKVASR